MARLAPNACIVFGLLDATPLPGERDGKGLAPSHSGASRHLPTRGEDQLLVEWGGQVAEAPPALRATFPTRGEDQLLVEWGGQVGEAPPALRATSPHVGRTNSW